MGLGVIALFRSQILGYKIGS